MLATIHSCFKEKEAINSYEKMLKSARCFPGGGSQWWAWAPCCLCACLSFHTERRSRRRQQTGSGGLSCLRLEEEEEEEAVTVEWREGLVFPPVAWKAPFLQTTFRLAFLFLQHDHEDEKNKHYFGKNNTLSPEPMVNIKADLDLHETDYLHFSIHNSYFPINISKRKTRVSFWIRSWKKSGNDFSRELFLGVWYRWTVSTGQPAQN